MEKLSYEEALRKYINLEDALKYMPIIIQHSVSVHYLQFTMGGLTAYEMLVNLKQKVALSDYVAMIDLQNQYRLLLAPPPKQALEAWIDKWEDIYRKGIKRNLPEVMTQSPHFNFLDAIEDIFPRFYIANLPLVFEKRRQEVVDFTELLDRFRKSVRIHLALQGKLLDGHSTFAEIFQGEEMANKEEKPSNAEWKSQKEEMAKR